MMKIPRSIYVGVSFSLHSYYSVTDTIAWEARITIKGLTLSLGAHKTEWEAAEAYNTKALTLGRKTNKRRIKYEHTFNQH